ncbi:MAG: hypothetical protein H6732_12570 [Alphaproteobacteria bacterium]|nr:hypothetical protein [Alphaproteobacteria bacterium]
MHTRLVVFALALVATVGCRRSDGDLGDAGVVRFSQIVDYKETEDFGAPVAVDRALLVALQRPQSVWGNDEETRADLVLDVEGGKDVTIVALGFAQYAVTFARPGEYRLVAVDERRGGRTVDRRTIVAEPLGGVRFHATADVFTDDEPCNDWREVPLDELKLYRNERAKVYAVPESRSGEPMLGLLDLVADPVRGLEYDSPLIAHGQDVNVLTFWSNQQMQEGAVRVAMYERIAGKVGKVEVELVDDDRDVDCRD